MVATSNAGRLDGAVAGLCGVDVWLVRWFAVGKIDTLIQNHDNAALQQAQVVAAVQQEKNEALAKQVAQQAEEYKALAVQVNAQNAALEQANVNLANALVKQQRTDATLP